MKLRVKFILCSNRFVLLLLFFLAGCGRNGDETVFIRPGNELIRYTGRFDWTDPSGPRFSWPGTSVRARFTGPLLDLIFSDSAPGTPHPVSGRNSNYLEIVIDDREPVTLELKPGDIVYRVAEELGEGEHNLTIFKRTGADVGPVRFRGLRLEEGRVLKPLPPRPDLRLEFIGDSITCGYGNEASGPEEGEEKVHYLEFEPQKQSEGIGADWHPGLKIHQRMADKLTEAISGILFI